MGELFVNRHEWLPLVTNRWIDFIRLHISAVGGLSMARKVAACCEFFNVRTAWHGPGNVSPVGHAVNLHLDLASYNFGIQEQHLFSPTLRELFPGAPEIKGGYMYCERQAGPRDRHRREGRREVPVHLARAQPRDRPAARRHDRAALRHRQPDRRHQAGRVLVG